MQGIGGKTMKLIHASGTRKRAVARATLYPGEGNIKINNKPLLNFEPEFIRLKLAEPLILSGDISKEVDINVRVFGGGINSQAEASRLAIAKALAKFDKKLEKVYLDYDRLLLVADVRRKETHKPNRHGKARAKVTKSYR